MVIKGPDRIIAKNTTHTTQNAGRDDPIVHTYPSITPQKNKYWRDNNGI